MASTPLRASRYPPIRSLARSARSLAVACPGWGFQNVVVHSHVLVLVLVLVPVLVDVLVHVRAGSSS